MLKRAISVMVSATVLSATSAHADELRLTVPEPIARIEGDPILRAHLTTVAPSPLFQTVPAPILSRGAKTAIIVGAIVGGVLLIFGVIVLAKPGKHVP